ncbi:MAG: glycosyltransferase [Gemmatimonadota bacterium]
MTSLAGAPVALQRCDVFVGRTMNWNYDHLRSVPRYRVVVAADALENRDEFPLLEAFRIDRGGLLHRAWNRVLPERLYPPLASRLRALRPVVLHSHMGYVAARDVAIHAALHVPWLISFHGADIYMLGQRPEWRAIYGRLFERASRVLALGPHMAEALTALGCPLERIAIHPLGVDVAHLPARPRVLARGQPLEILFAGTFREKKGFRYLVDAVALAVTRGVNCRLTVVAEAGGRPGDREEEAEASRRIAEHGLERHVRRFPLLPFQQLIELGLASHVFVAPSVTASDGDKEGVPIVVQQMMATAMPVITTAHSDIPFLFGPLAHQLVPERDAAAIAGRLEHYAADPAAIVRDGEAQRARIEEGFDVRHCAARLAEHYDRLAR